MLPIAGERVMATGLRSSLGTRGLLVAAGLLFLPALAQAQPQPAANPQLAAAQAAFDALPEVERKAIQNDLIWAGHFNGAVSGSYGPLTFRGINALKAGSRGAPDGILTPVERRALAQAAGTAREAAGFRVITDERTGIRIGIPTKLLPRREATATGGGRWQSEDGRVTLDTSTAPAGDTVEALFEKATSAAVPGRKITYKLLRPDFFVVTGETPSGRFYRRLSSGPGGLRGFSIGYDKALAPSIDKLVIAIASSFEPFPTGPAPATAGPAVASVATPGAAPPVVVGARPTERFGVGLAISDKLVLTATAAIDSCKSLKVSGRPARLRIKDDASGLALLDVDGTAAGAPPGLRSEALVAQESFVLMAFGDSGGQRTAMALPGQSVRLGAGEAVFAPLQPGQAGSPVFDRQGRLAGLVTANPSDKVLIAGVAPQRAYAIAVGAAMQALLGKAGVTLQAATPGPEISTGAVVEKVGKAALPVACGL
ncbi:S1 family peptidase [Bosea sp. 2RAB26]|uniref:S1 family peptidase n=1 Tax=Bosea sp. 2RAB26 TaxID=3237476 RepID=UPI003F9388A3